MPAPTAVNVPSSSSGTSARAGRPLLILAGILLVVLGFLFRASFDPDQAMFANDGPLGLMKSRVHAMPGALLKVWYDLNWLGFEGDLPPTISTLLVWVLGALGSNKFYPAITLLCVGCSAGILFRQLRFSPVACILGGLAAALNTDFFSYACWGLGSLAICVASVFLAFAALASTRFPVWLRVVLAGAALGHAVMDGYDNGAIFSLYLASFAILQPLLNSSNGAPKPRRFAVGLLAAAGLAVVSGVVAAHVLKVVVPANVTKVVGMEQDRESAASRWNFATQWSLPPKEVLRAAIPGLYGYRMDTANGGNYWGLVGSDPEWDKYFAGDHRDPTAQPRRTLRFSGAGHYAGVLVLLLAGFAIVQAFRKSGAVFSPTERRWVWFWSAAALLSLLFALGRFAPFYQIIYSLPYFSTIRNPVKFLHPFSLATLVLFAYGVEALFRGYVANRKASESGCSETFQRWWKTATSLDKRFVSILVILSSAAFMSWMIYGANRLTLVRHLAEVGFPDPKDASLIARFSHQEVGMFALILATSTVLLLLTLSGWLAGARARMAAILFGTILVLDLGRANLPWIVHYDWKDRYATNPLFDALRKAPQEGRVTGQLPFALPGEAGRLQSTLASVYGVEWLQHQFPFYDIQSIDIVQMPRAPMDYAAFKGALQTNPLREWELSNTRYLLTLAPLVDAMNAQMDPTLKRFKLHTAFGLSQNTAGHIKVDTNQHGPFALVEFAGALPRAMLFDHWQSSVSDESALKLLASTNFSPRSEVLISEQIPAPSVNTSTQPAGVAAFAEYSPTKYTLSTEARTPCILLVNDRYDPSWKVLVDGKEEPLLRANFVTRGVYLSPGNHRVTFQFERPQLLRCLSYAGWLLAAFLGLLSPILPWFRRIEN